MLDVCCGTGTIGISLAKVQTACLLTDVLCVCWPVTILLRIELSVIVAPLSRLWKYCHLMFLPSQRVKKVIGIELCREAVEDAKVNAELNGKSSLIRTHALCCS